VIDMSAFQMWLAVLIGWLDRQEREARAYLIEETIASCEHCWVTDICTSRMTTDRGLPCGRSRSAGRPCGKSPRS
jgi:hypothetical protein